MEQASQSSTKSKQRMNLQFPMRPKNPATGSTTAAAAAASLGTTASVGIETPKGNNMC